MPSEQWERDERSYVCSIYRSIHEHRCLFCNRVLSLDDFAIVEYIGKDERTIARHVFCYDDWARIRNNMCSNYSYYLRHMIRVIGPNFQILYARVRLPEDNWFAEWDEPTNLIPVPGIDKKIKVRGGRR